jgi:hypothetical protein
MEDHAFNRLSPVNHNIQQYNTGHWAARLKQTYYFKFYNFYRQSNNNFLFLMRLLDFYHDLNLFEMMISDRSNILL